MSVWATRAECLSFRRQAARDFERLTDESYERLRRSKLALAQSEALVRAALWPQPDSWRRDQELRLDHPA
jgi:hypothetical protein